METEEIYQEMMNKYKDVEMKFQPKMETEKNLPAKTNKRIDKIVNKSNQKSESSLETRISNAQQTGSQVGYTTLEKSQLETVKFDEFFTDLNRITENMRRHANEYNKLDAIFRDLIISPIENSVNKLTYNFKSEKKKQQLKEQAFGKRGRELQSLVDRMQRNLEQQTDEISNSAMITRGLQERIFQHRVNMQTRIGDMDIVNVDLLTDSTYTKKLKSDYADDRDLTADALNEYKSRISELTENLDYDGIAELNEKIKRMQKIYADLTNKMINIEKLESDIILEQTGNAKAVETIEIGIQTTDASMKQAQIVYETLKLKEKENEETIKNLMPNFSHQAGLAGLTINIMENKDDLIGISASMKQLSEYNVKAIEAFSKARWDMFKRPVLDIDSVRNSYQKTKELMDGLKEEKIEYITHNQVTPTLSIK